MSIIDCLYTENCMCNKHRSSRSGFRFGSVWFVVPDWATCKNDRVATSLSHSLWPIPFSMTGSIACSYSPLHFLPHFDRFNQFTSDQHYIRLKLNRSESVIGRRTRIREFEFERYIRHLLSAGPLIIGDDIDTNPSNITDYMSVTCVYCVLCVVLCCVPSGSLEKSWIRMRHIANL